MPDSLTRIRLLWSCLQVLTRNRHEALLRVFGTLEDAAKHIDSEILRGLGCREETVQGVLQRLDAFDPEKEEALLASAGAQIIALGDPAYPERLADIPDA